MNPGTRFCTGAERKPGHKAAFAQPLAQLLDEFISSVSAAQEKFAPLTQLWSQLLPEQLSSHCRIISVSAGCLNVAADSPVYRHEMRLCSHELLAQIQHACPRAHIKEIRITIGSLPLG